ncbi:MAG: DoxX family membrane protein [Candidatus Eremiobacteraeota bacterium]|nr:DoxX family membrane protein [Candidatus Eremiobacteraeota bacterium]
MGAVLVVAGALKIGQASALAASIAGFHLLPAGIVAPLAIVLPFVEVFVGLYLIVGLFTKIAAVVAAAQYALYAGVIASAVIRHIPANCGCFGPNDSATADWPHVGFDLLLCALCAFVAWHAPGALALDGKLKKT